MSIRLTNTEPFLDFKFFFFAYFGAGVAVHFIRAELFVGYQV